MTPRRGARAAGTSLVPAVVATGCSAYDTTYPRSPSTAFRDCQTTTLGRLFGAAATRRPRGSGVEYIRYGRTALEARLALADLAERSLDLQYYIWDADISGRLLAERVVRAAERGVRDCSTTTASSIATPRSRGCRHIPTSTFGPSTPFAAAAAAGGTSSPTRRA